MQLLVFGADEESYKEIRESLDALKPLVETSELWLYKPPTPPSAIPKKDWDTGQEGDVDDMEEGQDDAVYVKVVVTLFVSF